MTLMKPNPSAFRMIRSRLKLSGISFLVLILSLCQQSQSLAQSVLAASGGMVKNASGTVDFTLGQIDFFYVDQDSSNLSFGIQQPFVPDTLPRVDSLACGAYMLLSMGLPIENTPYQNTLRLPYYGGNGNRFDTMRFSSQGVTGLTLLLLPGKLAKGDSVLVFTISGTPTREGIAGFSIDFGNATCELTINVGPEPPRVDSLLCSGATFMPEKFYVNVPYQGFMDLPYVGGNAKIAPADTFLSETITGLTARFAADTLKRSGGKLRLRLEGLADRTGTARIPVAIGGKTCFVEVPIEEYSLIIPNFFSPNGDGANDLWEIPNFQYLHPNGKVIILDRNGRKLVEFNGSFNGWDGTINGKNALSGVYWYIVQTEIGTDSFKGNLTLIR
jgi:gliding motility-associated-like protein